ncbi:Sok2p [Sugiyamaella lignohabitans]|uniref:Sok2p n=1 Tax=Sugiyamaella lignohabitans TaxID=796027 RepID=A0A167CZ70_9ASCO|nr:Sok2p [Sugiyamaella lignohabitans]ANB12284.1 Sok2p [Sugiyamaella lignohabitans]
MSATPSTGSNTGSMTTPASSSNNTTPNIGSSSARPRVTTTLWDDESTLCFQVEAKGVCVARREDNDMINGTKLLNVAGMTRGRRDGILKAEKVRHVVKIGAMHLKGVWIPFDRAMTFANKEGIADMLYPLFLPDIKSLLYQNGNGSSASSSSVNVGSNGGSNTATTHSGVINPNSNPNNVGVLGVANGGLSSIPNSTLGAPANSNSINTGYGRMKDEFYSYSNPSQDDSSSSSDGRPAKRRNTQPQAPPSSQPQQQQYYYQYQDVYNNGSQYSGIPHPQQRQQQQQQQQQQLQQQPGLQRYISTLGGNGVTPSAGGSSSGSIPNSSTPSSQSPVYEYAPPPQNAGQQPLYQGYPSSYTYQVLQQPQSSAGQSPISTNAKTATGTGSYQAHDSVNAGAANTYQPDYYAKPSQGGQQQQQAQQTGPYGLPPQPSYAAYYGGSAAIPTNLTVNRNASYRPNSGTLPPPSVLSGTTDS